MFTHIKKYVIIFFRWLIDSFKTVEIRKELEALKFEYHKVQKYLLDTGHLQSYALTSLNFNLNQSNQELQYQITLREKQIIELDEKILLEEHGFYRPRYNLKNSEQYRQKLDQVQNQQKDMIKEGQASMCAGNWSVGDDKKSGEKMIKDNQKLILRCFNNECEAAIAKLKYNTIEAAQKKINKAYEAMNKFGSVLLISITPQYLQTKLEEMHVAYEYELKKQEEKEEAAAAREKLKEDAKIAKELETARQVNEKEKTHFEKRLSEINQKIENSSLTPAEAKRITDEKKVIEAQLVVCEKRDADLDYRQQNGTAGYVYIISNLGSFGENVYKIGVTRRLDPHDRIDELGSASVPFRFDTHALIFSESAFQLENALHKAFHHKRVNLINQRKEFFKLDLEELNNVLKSNFHKHFELKMVADALDYRESVKLRQLQSNFNDDALFKHSL